MATGDLKKRPDHILDPLISFLNKRQPVQSVYVRSIAMDAYAKYEVGYMSCQIEPREVLYTSPERIAWYVVTPNGYMVWCSKDPITIQKDEEVRFVRTVYDPCGPSVSRAIDSS